MLAETLVYFAFNGAARTFAQDANRLHASVGETVRIVLGAGGQNFTSSFHAIGEILDRAYPFAALGPLLLKGVQTVSVPPGGATMVELELHVPGRYILVDHVLNHLERGLAGYQMVDGPEDPAIFQGRMISGSGH